MRKTGSRRPPSAASCRPGRRQERVALEVAGGQDDVLGRVADVAEEAVAPVVEGVAEPGAAGDRLEAARRRVEAEVAAAGRPIGGASGRSRGPDLAAVARRRAVDRVVEAPVQVVHHRLDVELAEPGEDPSAHVGPAVAVGVLEVQMSGVAATKTPPFHTATPVGQDSPSAKTCPSSKPPSPSRSISRRTRPIGGSARFSANGLVVLRRRRRGSRSSRRRRAGRPRRRPPPPGR